ncbi:hypothetical protein D3C81_1743420 [compost metagenome]
MRQRPAELSRQQHAGQQEDQNRQWLAEEFPVLRVNPLQAQSHALTTPIHEKRRQPVGCRKSPV